MLTMLFLEVVWQTRQCFQHGKSDLALLAETISGMCRNSSWLLHRVLLPFTGVSETPRDHQSKLAFILTELVLTPGLHLLPLHRVGSTGLVFFNFQVNYHPIAWKINLGQTQAHTTSLQGTHIVIFTILCMISKKKKIKMLVPCFPMKENTVLSTSQFPIWEFFYWAHTSKQCLY